MKTRPYIILTPSYCVSSGVRVLHELCHELNGLGFDAKLMLTSDLSPDPTQLLNPALNTPVINNDFATNWEQINNDSIVISSDGIQGNPFNAKRLVRYVLGKEGDLPKDEFKVYFSRAFQRDKSVAPLVLYHLPVDLSIFNTNNAPVRDQDMLWLGKGAKYCTEPLPNVALMSYSWPATRAELAANFRRTRYLYSYDAVSATNIEAVLCGAVVIFKHVSYHDWVWTRSDMEDYELGIGGFAFGDSPAEIERAHRTGHEMIALTQYHVAAFRSRLLDFVHATQSHFNYEI